MNQESECTHKTITSKKFFMCTKWPFLKEFTSASVSSTLSMLRRGEAKQILFSEWSWSQVSFKRRSILEARFPVTAWKAPCLGAAAQAPHSSSRCCYTSLSPSWSCTNFSSSWCCYTTFSPYCSWYIITTYFFAGLYSWPYYVVFLKRFKIILLHRKNSYYFLYVYQVVFCWEVQKVK